MKTEIQKFEGYSLATIDKKDSRIAKLVITAEINSDNTLKEQATFLLLPDALLSGAGGFLREEFLNEVSKIGGHVDIEVNFGRISIVLSSSSEQFSKLLKLAEVMIEKPTFSAKELKRIKKTVENELHLSKENSRAISIENLNNHFYGKKDCRFSYDRDDLIGQIKSVTRTQLTEAHKLLVERHWCVSVGSNKAVLEEVVRFLNRLNKKEKTSSVKSSYDKKAVNSSIILRDIPSKQNIDFNLGVPIPLVIKDADYVPLMLGVTVLCKWGGFSGRLMSTVREKEGLTYSIYGRLEGSLPERPGHFRVMTFFAPDKAKQGLVSTYREIRKIYEKGITKTELQKFKTIIHTQEVLLGDSLPRLLDSIHGFHCQNFTINDIEEYKMRVKGLTLSEVNNAIKKYLDPTKMSISGAGPVSGVKKDLEEWHKSLLNE